MFQESTSLLITKWWSLFSSLPNVWQSSQVRRSQKKGQRIDSSGSLDLVDTTESLVCWSRHFKRKQHFSLSTTLLMRYLCHAISREKAACLLSFLSFLVVLRASLKSDARRKSPHFSVTCCNYCP